MARVKKPRLVIVEWEDSAQPISRWQHFDDIEAMTMRIASVGWLVKNDKNLKALAPNIGGLDGNGFPQCSGVIAIPTRCVISIKNLE